MFNFFNFYTPMVRIAFFVGAYEPIFITLLTQQGFKQNWANIKQWLIPIRDMEPKIKKLDEEFRVTLDKYAPDSKTPVLEVTCDSKDALTIRKYQTFKNDMLYNEKANIIGDYMELVA